MIVQAATIWDQARAWLAEDPDPDTQAELAAILAAGDLAAVTERFARRLEFGTAGLRGALGSGPNRMNRAVVMRTTAGLAAFLAERGGKTVAVGYDARHKSDVFAADTAAVFQGAGLQAVILPRPLPTPVLAFAVQALRCEAGVMVTASHNPPQDNGYKVYLGDGAQIAPPADAEISSCIDSVGPLDTVPRHGGATMLGEDVVEAYVDRVARLVRPESPRGVRIAYTPLHGVGRDVLLAVFERAGFPPPHVVPQQAEPDPDFPTVAFPNPEEPGAMDLALALGEEVKADVVLANDPDADRCAVAVGRRQLSGDEVGTLLAAHLLRRERGLHGTFATTLVSSSLLGKIAARNGLEYAETLTGFKWLSHVPGLRFAYEEALGYCVDPSGVRDKDGVSAALLIAELAATLKAEGRTLLDLLDDLAREYGVHVTDQLSIRVADLADIDMALHRLRSGPPSALGGRAVLMMDDLATGVDGLPPTDGVRFRLDGDARIVVRPSGTEPKLKCYLELIAPAGEDAAAARSRCAHDLVLVKRDLGRLVGMNR